MNKLKRLQKQYAAGKLTKEQYNAAVADLLDDEDLTQEEHDDALEFDPEDDDSEEKPIYTQSDVDGIVMKKARNLVKKAAREAGVDVSDFKPQELVTKIAELAAAGTGKAKETDQEIKDLRKKAANYDAIATQVEGLVVENAVLKAAGKYNAVNPAQVARALNTDYKDLLEFDEDSGALDPKSVQKAIRRIAEVEPNLFQTAGAGDDEEDDLEDKQGADFSGKTPGGAGTGGSKRKKEEAKLAANKAAALEMMGFKPDQK